MGQWRTSRCTTSAETERTFGTRIWFCLAMQQRQPHTPNSICNDYTCWPVIARATPNPTATTLVIDFAGSTGSECSHTGGMGLKSNRCAAVWMLVIFTGDRQGRLESKQTRWAYGYVSIWQAGFVISNVEC